MGVKGRGHIRGGGAHAEVAHGSPHVFCLDRGDLVDRLIESRIPFPDPS